MAVSSMKLTEAREMVERENHGRKCKLLDFWRVKTDNLLVTLTEHESIIPEIEKMQVTHRLTIFQNGRPISSTITHVGQTPYEVGEDA